jgi:hypothetical protein
MMSGVNVTFRNITPNGDAGWSIVTFAHNVIFDHLVVSGSGSGGSGRCVTKMTFRDSIFEPRPGGSGNSLAIEEVPDDTTIENCKLVGGFVYSNNDSTINKLKFINNTLYSAGLAMYLSGSIGSAIISGNHFRAAGDNNVNPSSLSTKYLTAHLYTGEDTNTRIVYTGNIFESINGDAMLYGIGTGGAYTAIHSSNNTLINVLPDTMSLISNAGLEKGPFETIRRTSVVDLWIDTQSISYDNTVLKYMYQLDNIATQVPSWTYNSTSKAFMLNVDIVGRGTASDNVYFLYKGVATVSQNDAVTTTAVVPTIVSSVSGGADASVAITSPSATSIKVALTIANQPMALIVKVEMLNPLKVLPY